MMLLDFFKRYIPNNERSRLMGKNIIASFVLKAVSILLSLMIVPATINYVSSEQYGIWLTLSSIIAWISYFDIGFAHGFRYRFAESLARGEYIVAKKYVSTTYALLFLVFGISCIVALIINYYLDWTKILNLNHSMAQYLCQVFACLICFFCMNMVLKVISTLLIADQRPAASSFIDTLGQFLSFVIIIVLSHTTNGGLLFLVFIFSGVPCLIWSIASISIFKMKRYDRFCPSLSSIDFGLTKGILGMGTKYFYTMCSMFLIFQFLNIIISRELGPDYVTQYNVAYKYFNVLLMSFTIIVSPLWSAFTEAYTKGDFTWMKSTIDKMKRLIVLFMFLGVVMLLISQYFYKMWVGDKVQISFMLSLFVFLQIVSQFIPALYVYCINGLGKMRIQILVYSIFAFFAIPSLILLCRYWGVPGMLSYYVVVYVVLGIVLRKQFYMLLSGKAHGWWNK